MALRVRRRNLLSTRPIYLPAVPARALQAPSASYVTAEPLPEEAVATVHIYTEGRLGSPDPDWLARQLYDMKPPLALVVEGEVPVRHLPRARTEARDRIAAAARALAWARLRERGLRRHRVVPLRGEVDEECERLRARVRPHLTGLVRRAAPPPTALYEGAGVQAALRELLAAEVLTPDRIHIVVTDREIARWNREMRRWVTVPVVSGAPLLVSASPAAGGLPEKELMRRIHRALRRSLSATAAG